MKKPVILKLCSALMAGTAALFFAIYGAFRWAVFRAANPVPDGASSIGIIGGADGPTAVFVTGGLDMGVYLWLGGALLAGALGLFLWARRLGKKQG